MLARPYPGKHHHWPQDQPLGLGLPASKKLFEVYSQRPALILLSSLPPAALFYILHEISRNLTLGTVAARLPFLQNVLLCRPIYLCDKNDLDVPFWFGDPKTSVGLQFWQGLRVAHLNDDCEPLVRMPLRQPPRFDKVVWSLYSRLSLDPGTAHLPKLSVQSYFQNLLVGECCKAVHGICW